ncbi:phage major capsid protein [Aliidiomarina sp. Khilg15.8]
MKLHELRAKRDNIAREMRALNDGVQEDAAFTQEQRDKWDGMKSQLDSLSEKIEREEELRELDQKFVQDNDEEIRDHQERESGNDQEKRAAAVFDKMLRHGAAELSSEERSMVREMRANGTDPNEKGGYTIPRTMLNKIHESMKAFGGIAENCQLMVTSTGASLPWPTSNGTSEEGELLGENTATGEQDVSFGEVELGAHKLSSKVIRVSNELLNDSGIDVQSFLARRIASRLARGEAKYVATGSGTGTPKQPLGVVNAVGQGHETIAMDALDYRDLVRLKHSVDPAYRSSPKTAFCFNDKTLQELTEMKDLQGRPIWLPEVAGATPATILNERYFVDQAIPDFEAGAKFALYGDWDMFILRRVQYMVLKRLVERYAEYDQTGFLAFHRFDCVLEDSAAIKAAVRKAA